MFQVSLGKINDKMKMWINTAVLMLVPILVCEKSFQVIIE